MDRRLKPGADIRMWSKRMDWSAKTGKLERLVGLDSVVVRIRTVVFGKAQTNRYLMPVWEFDTLQVWEQTGANRFDRSVVRGGMIGAAIGGVGYGIKLGFDRCGTSSRGSCDAGSIGAGAAIGAVGGALAGLVVGAVMGGVGSAGSEGDWVNVSYPRPAG